MEEVIAAFTGTGKAYFCSKHVEALDLVCMPFKYGNLPLEFTPERCKADSCGQKVILGSGEYLSDYFEV